MPTYYTQHRDEAGNVSSRPVEGRKFRVDIGGGQFWFFVHEVIRITDLRSGQRVIDVPHQAIAAARGDRVQAAKNAFRDWLEGRDQHAVRVIIESAEELKR